jgi:hypothetical protein
MRERNDERPRWVHSSFASDRCLRRSGNLLICALRCIGQRDHDYAPAGKGRGKGKEQAGNDTGKGTAITTTDGTRKGIENETGRTEREDGLTTRVVDQQERENLGVQESTVGHLRAPTGHLRDRISSI